MVRKRGLTEGRVQFNDDIETEKLRRYCAELMIGIENCMKGGSVIRGGTKGMSTATSGLPSMGVQKKDEYHEATFMNNKYVFSNGEKELTAEVEILPKPGGDPDSIGVYTKTAVNNVTEDELEETLEELCEDALRPAYSDRLPDTDNAYRKVTV
jgi:hypothetical protein